MATKLQSKQQPKKPSTEVVASDESKMGYVVQQPDYINGGEARGNENVGTEDMVVPRLEIVQGLSPAVKPGAQGFIEGAVMGMMNNSVTRQLYREAFVVPVFFAKQYLVWRDRKADAAAGQGGFFGAYNTAAEAAARAKAEGGEAKGIIVIDTPQHFCLQLMPNGKLEEIMIPMARTKAKISRAWNSTIRLAGGDRFSRVYKITTVLQQNAKGDFYNFVITPLGFPKINVYRAAEELYNRIQGGLKVVMDVGGLDEAGAAHNNDDDDPEM